MRKTLFLVLGGLALFAAGASAQEAVRSLGAVSSHRLLERYEMSVGVTATQTPRRPVRFDEEREVLSVPSHYGTLTDITGDGATAILWYRDASGLLRNVTIHDPATHAVAIQAAPTTRYEAESRER